jgi:LDH2 family malate/lactate/ureidoglycolate dehydrogenase
MMADSGQSPTVHCLSERSSGPVFIDMATSAVAAGKLNVARAQAKPIPLGWLLDKDGKPTPNPNAQLEGGVMLPPRGHPDRKIRHGVGSARSPRASE